MYVQPSLPWFGLRRFPNLSTTKSPVAFHLYGCFVSKYHVEKACLRFTDVPSGPIQTLGFIRFANHLAVGTSSYSPAERPPTPENGTL